MTGRLRLALPLFGLLLSFPAAAQEPIEDYLVGDWGLGGPPSCETPNRIRFEADGGVQLYDTYSGAWSVAEDGAVRLELAGREPGQPGLLMTLLLGERRADGFAGEFVEADRRWPVSAVDCTAAEAAAETVPAGWVFSALPPAGPPLPIGEARIADGDAAFAVRCWTVPLPLLVLSLTPPEGAAIGGDGADPVALVFEVVVEGQRRRFILPMRARQEGGRRTYALIAPAEAATDDQGALIAALQHGTSLTLARAVDAGTPEPIASFDLRNSFQAIDAALRHGGCLEAMG